MDLAVFDQSFQGQYLFAVGLGCKGQATADGLAVQQYRAGPTLALAAAPMNALDLEYISEQFQ